MKQQKKAQLYGNYYQIKDIVFRICPSVVSCLEYFSSSSSIDRKLITRNQDKFDKFKQIVIYAKGKTKRLQEIIGTIQEEQFSIHSQHIKDELIKLNQNITDYLNYFGFTNKGAFLEELDSATHQWKRATSKNWYKRSQTNDDWYKIKKGPDGSFFILGKNFKLNEGPWRISYFDEKGKGYTHNDYLTYEDALAVFNYTFGEEISPEKTTQEKEKETWKEAPVYALSDKEFNILKNASINFEIKEANLNPLGGMFFGIFITILANLMGISTAEAKTKYDQKAIDKNTLQQASVMAQKEISKKNLPASDPNIVNTNSTQKNLGSNSPNLYEMIERHEGKRNTVYYISKDKSSPKIPHIGIGFNLTRADADEKLKAVGANLNDILKGAKLSNQQIDTLFRGDLKIARNGAMSFLENFNEQPISVQNVLIDMTFNMGINTLSEFKNFKKYLLKKDYPSAAKEMLNSRWAKQVESRANELSNIINNSK